MNRISAKKRYAFIDITKLLFAYIVMLHHILHSCNINNELTNFVGFLINIIVPYFFVASGYFFFKKIESNLDNKKTITVSYLKRIFTMYVIWQGIMLILRIPEIIAIGPNVKQQAIYWLKYIRVFLFIGDYQLWYLIGLVWAIIIFYILFIKNKLSACVIAAVFFYVIKIALDLFSDVLMQNAITSKLVLLNKYLLGTTRNGLYVGFIFFIIGCLFVKFKEEKLNKKWIVYLITILICIVIFVANANNYSLLTYILLPVLVASVFVLTMIIDINVKTMIVAKMSSMVYVSHVLFIIVIIDWLNIKNMAIAIPLVFLIVTGVSLAVIGLSKKVKLLKSFY